MKQQKLAKVSKVCLCPTACTNGMSPTRSLPCKPGALKRQQPGTRQVIGVSRLRAKYESHEAKRALCAAYDLFLADERVVPLLPKLLGMPLVLGVCTACMQALYDHALARDTILARDRGGPAGMNQSNLLLTAACACGAHPAGRDFFQKKKQPIPVDLRGKDWAGQVAKACGATYMFHTGGTSLNIRFPPCSTLPSCLIVSESTQRLTVHTGSHRDERAAHSSGAAGGACLLMRLPICVGCRVARSSMSADECTANVVAAMQGALQHIPRKWANVRALHLKCADSAALPIYQALPDAPVRIVAGGKAAAPLAQETA